MLLTLSTTYQPATDLGYLLHKNPVRLQTVKLSFGVAHVFYPEATDERCTAAVVVEVDPVSLVRGDRGQSSRSSSLGQYVNDRPYAASSFVSVALNRLFGTALAGRSKERPELVARPIPFTLHLPVLPCRGGEGVLRRLFEPLGYDVEAATLPLDDHFPEWGDSAYLDAALSVTAPVKDVLEHLFVLIPVLDDDKHYWVGPEEVDKLLRRGSSWLAAHPERELIASRYLRHDRRLTREALTRILENDDNVSDPDAEDERHDLEEEAVEARISLNQQRLAAVVDVLSSVGARSVVDLGCGSGKLVQALLNEPWVEKVVGVDVAHRALESAARRLHLATMSPRQRSRVDFWQGGLTYRDERLAAFDAAAAVEVVEHLDPWRLGAFERAVFAYARPRTVVLTTPNVEYNVRFETLPAGQLRHRDHRFEWTRAELADWATAVAGRHGYRVKLAGIGPEEADVGSPTQMAVFSEESAAK